MIIKMIYSGYTVDFKFWNWVEKTYQVQSSLQHNKGKKTTINREENSSNTGERKLYNIVLDFFSIFLID